MFLVIVNGFIKCVLIFSTENSCLYGLSRIKIPPDNFFALRKYYVSLRYDTFC